MNEIAKKYGSLEGYYFAFVMILLIMTPFFNGSNSAEGKLLSESFLWILLSLSFLTFITREKLTFILSPFEKTGILFFVFAVVSAVFAVYQVDAWLAVGRIFLMGCFFHFSLSQIKKDESLIEKLILLVVISGIIQVLFCLHQFLFTHWYSEVLPTFFEKNLRPNIRGGVLRTIGGFLNPNYLAAFLNIGIALSASVALFSRKSRMIRFVSGIATAFLVIGVVLSGSKGGLLVMALSLGILAFLKNRKLIWLFLVVLVLIVVIPNPVQEGFQRAVTSDPYISMRPGIWSSAVSLSLEKPLFGAGPDNFRYVGHRYAPATDFLLVNFSRFPRIAHNSILHSFAEFGIVGFMPLFLIICYLLWKSVRVILLKAEEEKQQYLKYAIATSFIGVFVHSIVDNVMNHRAIMVVLVIMAACFVVLLKRTSDGGIFLRDSQEYKLPAFRKSLLVLCFLMFFVIFLHYQILEPYFYEQEMAELTPVVSNLEQNIGSGEYHKADLESINKRLEDTGKRFSGNLAVWRLKAQLERAEYLKEKKFSNFLEASRSYQKVIDNLNGYAYAEMYAQLTLYFELVKSGYPKTDEILLEMRELGRRAIRANPQRAIYYQVAATVERESGNTGEAIRLLTKATHLEPNFLRGWYDLAMIARMRGNSKDYSRYEREINDALARIKSAKKPESDDFYAWQIITPPASQ